MKDSQIPPRGSDDAGGQPKLLLHKDLAEAPHGMAMINDELQVNAAGCFTLGKNVFVAPNGSTVLADGSGVHIPSVGVVKLGETVSGGGAFGEFATEADVPPPMKGCLAHPPFWYVALTSGSGAPR